MAFLAAARALSPKARGQILVGVAGFAIIFLMLAPPFPQPLGYHAFADTRVVWGLARFGDVVSNLGFALAGLTGLAVVFGARGRRLFEDGWEALPWRVFFVGLILVAAGSAYYHADPTTATLYWDRLAMAIAFLALFAAIVTERGPASTARWLLPNAVAFGVILTTIWTFTEAAGAGNLWIYLAVQILPALLLVVIMVLFPARRPQAKGLAWAAGFYAAAFVTEKLDHQIYAALGETISGHSIKHLLAAAAGGALAHMLARRARGSDDLSP